MKLAFIVRNCCRDLRNAHRADAWGQSSRSHGAPTEDHMLSKGRRKKAVKHSVLALADLVERRPVLGRESKIKGRDVFEHLLGAAYTHEC